MGHPKGGTGILPVSIRPKRARCPHHPVTYFPLRVVTTAFAIATCLIATALAAGMGASNTVTAAGAETYKIDPVHSSATFRVLHMGAGPFYGRFNTPEGTISFDGDGQLDFDVKIPIDSIDTGSERLDGHLKSPDFFNAKEHPDMTFKSKSARKTADRKYEVKGDLTIHGVTKSVTVEAEWTGTADMGRGKRCGFETMFTIKRSDYGMEYGLQGGALGDEVKIIVGMEAAAGGAP